MKPSFFSTMLISRIHLLLGPSQWPAPVIRCSPFLSFFPLHCEGYIADLLLRVLAGSLKSNLSFWKGRGSFWGSDLEALGIFSAAKILSLTNLNPSPTSNIPVGTLIKIFTMAIMFVGHMPHKWIPLCCYYVIISQLGRCHTPIKVIADSFHPIKNFLTSFFFAQLQHCFSNRTCNMPNVEVVWTLRLAFPYPLRYASMPVWDKHKNTDANWFQKGKASFGSLQFHRWTTTSLICLLVWLKGQHKQAFNVCTRI